MHVCVHVCVCGPSEVVRVRAWVHTWWAGSKQLAAPTTPSPVHPHTHCHCCPVSVKLLLAGTPRWVIVGPPARPCPPPPNGPPIASWAASPLPYPTAAELRRCPPPVTRVVHLGRFHRCRTGTFSFCYVSTSAHYLGGMMARPLHRLQVAVHCRPHTARLCGPLPDSACLYTLCVWRPPASLMSRCQAVWAVVRTPDWVAALRSWNFKSTHIGLTSALPCPMHDPPPLHHPPYPQLPRGRGGLTGAHFTWAMRTSPDPGPPDQLGPLLGAPPLTTWPGLHRAAFSVPLCVWGGLAKRNRIQ